jgi:hypothetical protein
MYEYRTASFILTGRMHGAPLDEVDHSINALHQEGWEVVQFTSSSTTAGLSVVILLRRETQPNSA